MLLRLARFAKRRAIVFLFATHFAITGLSRAQPVVSTGAPADEAAIAANRPGSSDLPTHSNGTPLSSSLFDWGPLSLRPSLRYRYIYANGLSSAPGRPNTSYIQSFTPTLLVEAENRWTLTYAPSFVWYSNPAFRDTVAQFVDGEGHWIQPGWSGTIGQQYSKTDASLIESGRQTGQQTATTRGALNWYAADFSYGVAADQTLNFIQGMTDTFSWSVQPNANYRIAPPLTIGVAAAAGYVLVYHASDLESLRPIVHAQYQLTGKTALDVSVGYDEWRFVAGNRNQVAGVYYSTGVSWQPFTETTVTASAEQSKSAAPFQNQASLNRKFSVGLRQRLLRHFQLELTMDDQNTDYVLDGSALTTARADRIRSYSARLSTTFLRRGTAAVFYRRNKNSSSQPGYGFSSGQVGFELGFAY